jgi:hypothetical protein
MVMALSLLAALIGVPWAAEASPDTSAIVSATNQYRAQNGLQPLAENAAMNAVAQSWAQQMAANGQMTHNPNYSTQIPAGWSAAGENVATGHRSPTLVVDAWMNSAGHRANILSTSYNSIGAGWFVDARGVSWSVQVFARYAGVTAPGVLYKNAYSGTIYEIVGTSPVSISFERWRDHYRYQAPLATSTDYVKYPWSSSIYAVTFWPGGESSWQWDRLTFEQWSTAGRPSARNAGWIKGSTYYQWSTSPELFVVGEDGVVHKLTASEWQASGYRGFSPRADVGFVKLTWSNEIARMSSVSAGQGSPITLAVWQSEGSPTPLSRSRFTGDQFYQFAGSPDIWYAGPTVNRIITFSEWSAAGNPAPTPR